MNAGHVAVFVMLAVVAGAAGALALRRVEAWAFANAVEIVPGR